MILQLVKFFDSQKELAEFIAELREYRAPVKPKNHTPVSKMILSPPTSLPPSSPVPATVHLMVLGALMPTQKNYE